MWIQEVEEPNPTQQLGLGAQQTNGEDDERTESDEPREEVEQVQKPVAETTPQTKEQVQVEDVTGEPEFRQKKKRMCTRKQGHPP
jgi:hypothetical protein